MKDKRGPQFKRGCVSAISLGGPAVRHVVIVAAGVIFATPVSYAPCAKPTRSAESRQETGVKQGYIIPNNPRPVGFLAPVESAVSQVPERQEPTARPWWIGFELGDGQIKLTSRQFHGTSNPAFGLGFVGGHRLGDRARIGLEVNGWLLQSFNLNNPAVGESVSNVLGVMDAFPIRNRPIFLRAGAGLALYQNNRPNESSGSGWSWTAGVGYEIRLTESFGLAPIADYATGSRGDGPNIVVGETGRRYSVVEFKAAIVWHFGKPH